MVRNIHRRGFTLVELLVVISIISILSAIVYANYNQARSSARDDIRKSSLKELQLAIELFKAQTGSYPDDLQADLVPDFIQDLPRDPFSNANYTYITDGSNTYYKLLSDEVEVNTVGSYEDEFARCPYNCSNGVCPATAPENTYAVYSFGAECQ